MSIQPPKLTDLDRTSNVTSFVSEIRTPLSLLLFVMDIHYLVMINDCGFAHVLYQIAWRVISTNYLYLYIFSQFGSY